MMGHMPLSRRRLLGTATASGRRVGSIAHQTTCRWVLSKRLPPPTPLQCPPGTLAGRCMV
jgi:hypothetical protein